MIAVTNRTIAHTDMFNSFIMDMNMARNDDIPFDVKDNGIEALISINNADAPNLIYIVRIDALEERKGYGTKFLEKLKIFAAVNEFTGLYAYPENVNSYNFFIKQGFEKALDGNMLFLLKLN